MGKRRDMAGSVLVTILGVWAGLLLRDHPIVGGVMAGVAGLCAGLIVYDVAYERGRAKSAPSDPSDTRVFAEITWRKLFRLYKRAGTDVQGKRVVAPYIGRWLRVSGRLQQVMDHSAGSSGLVSLKGKSGLSLWFGDDDYKRLEVLKPGSRIHVAGRIEEVWAIGIWLKDCQLERR
jgi:hypothetical protein